MTRIMIVDCETHGQRVASPGSRGARCSGCEQDMVARVRDGEPMRAIADEHGLTRERIRQIVFELDPQASALGRAVRAEQAAVLREVRRQVVIAEQTRGLPLCVVCWGPISRAPRGNLAARKHHTCSARCAKLWLQVRHHLDPAYRERHDLLVARRAIETGRSGHLVWAVNRLTGTARRDSNRRHPYSAKVAALLDEVVRFREGRTPPPGALPVPRYERTVKHGTTTGYQQGCRLECCRAAKRDDANRRRARLREQAAAS